MPSEVFGTIVAGDTSLVEWCWRRFGDPVTREDPAVCALSGRASGWGVVAVCFPGEDVCGGSAAVGWL